MNLHMLYDILNTINSVGINQSILEKKNGNVLVRAADDTSSVVVISEIQSNFIDHTMAIPNIKILLDRMRLFNFDNTKYTTYESSDDVDVMKSLSLREGRKTVSYTCSKPNLISIPNSVSSNMIVNNVVLSKSQIDDLVLAINAFNPEFINFVGDERDIIVKLSDGVSDNFVNVVGTNQTGGWSYFWKKDYFVKLIKLAIKINENVTLGINDRGIMYINLDDITFMLRPQIV